MTSLPRFIILVLSVFIFGLVVVLAFVRTYPKMVLEIPRGTKEVATTTPLAEKPPAVELPETAPKAATIAPTAPRIAEKKMLPPKILTPSFVLPPPPIKPAEGIATTTQPEVATTTAPAVSEVKIPPVDEEELMRAVVRIHCGNIYGSGFVVNPNGLVLTAAHVLMKAIEDVAVNCDVIFPRKHSDFGFYSEAHYRVGTILTPQLVEKFYKEQGFDAAALKTAFLENDPVFGGEFPYIKYPFCGPETLGDKILLFGYAANIGTSPTSLGSVLSRFEGAVLQYADIISIRKEPSKIYEGDYDYFPDFSHTLDENVYHPAVVIYSSNNFSGASGGLVFDTSQNCIIGINSAVATAEGDPRIFGFAANPNFSAVKVWLDSLFSR